ncbi:aminodeoxychorismate synthase component I [uncultured Litoreibacter sp.]|uniref:aminodeoxychorismate synthase component I n=1 Tax=uncultured Litoreibacter sp. TaxID=1392394 RepID=UPI0026153D1A|nr:aminodeoxychorismate synthase component I [uncultured Litoreibacter sp.]
MTNAKVIFDSGPVAGGTEFSAPVAQIRADTPAEAEGAFNAMQQAHSDGHWLAGYISYEFGYLTSSKLAPLLPPVRDMPLLHFGVFDAPISPQPVPNDTQATLCPMQPLWDFARYAKAFQTVHDYISAGDIYQANLTFPLTSRFTGSVAQLYAQLKDRQPVPHGALVDLGGTALLSRSPELFFSLSEDSKLTTRPMKGTAARGKTVAIDDALRDELQASEKNRAENLMIVDLLRNDMSRVSEIGSVAVPKLFAVERFATLHQMTSCITSQMCQGISFKDLFEALFPCGSITGAPKLRAMQIIRDIETQPREAYCGSIGWIAPDGAMELNVAIRTLQCRQDKTVQMNVGGGVVYDSTAEGEFEEALLKSRFADLSQ